MKILPFAAIRLNNSFNSRKRNHIKQNNITSNFNNYPKNYYLNSVSFSGTRAIDLVTGIGEENFPSEEIIKSIDSLGNCRNYSLHNIHLDYYKDLLTCKTLDEAKEKYPEFKNVIDAKDIDMNSINKQNSLYKIFKSDRTDIDINTFSLELLKKHYGKLTSVCRKDEFWGLSHTALHRICNLLNIKVLDSRYMATITAQSDKIREMRKAQWQDPKLRQELSEKVKERWQNPEYKKAEVEKLKQRWQDPKYKERLSEKLKQRWQDPKARQMLSDAVKEMWQNSKLREE